MTKQSINLTKAFVTIPFGFTAEALFYIGKKCHLTYNAVKYHCMVYAAATCMGRHTGL